MGIDNSKKEEDAYNRFLLILIPLVLFRIFFEISQLKKIATIDIGITKDR